MPIISFIVTYYNIPLDLLKECLESILSLSLKSDEREIILIDDGSDENPLEHLPQYKNDIIYFHQDNAGLSQARNAGIKIAKGHYIQFVDGDDMLISNEYNKCLDLARDKAYDMIMFGLTSSQRNTNKNRHQQLKSSGCEYMKTYNIHATACGYIFRKHTLGSLCFTPGIYHEDEEFTPLLLLRIDRLLVINTDAYFYRKRTGSITTKNNLPHIVKRFENFKGIILKLHKISSSLDGNQQEALKRRVAQLTMDYIYKVARDPNGVRNLEYELRDLKRNGLFPLPANDYTVKYKLFRIMTNYRIGRMALTFILPFIKQEQ